MKTNNNLNFFNQLCLGLTRFAALIIVAMMLSCSDENALFDIEDLSDVTTAPDTPQNLTVKNITSATVTLEWDAVAGAREYIIYQDKTLIATNTAPTHTVVNLKFSTSYRFSVRACNSRGCSDESSALSVDTSEAPAFFSIAYPNMESTTPDTSRPVFVSGRNCNIQNYTLDGKARYSISALTDGTGVVPIIDPTTGVVNNKSSGASPGTYRVTVTVSGNTDCNTNVLVYNTVIPTDRAELEAAINNGIGLHGNVGNFNYIITSQITDMSALFENRYNFNGDITEWDTSQVKNMNGMFWFAEAFNQPIGGWDTSQVYDMSSMFHSALVFNQPLSNWNTEKIQDMSKMFWFAKAFNQPIGEWETSQVRYMKGMFFSADSFDQPIEGWNTSKAIDMSSMFYSASVFDQPLSNWDTSQVKDMSWMFYNAYAFNQPIGEWETSNVTKMNQMFSLATNFNQPIGDWNTSKVEDMGSMFLGADSFNKPIGGWNTSQVTGMEKMFFVATAFDQDLSGWVVTNVLNHQRMFQGSAMADKPEKHPKWP